MGLAVKFCPCRNLPYIIILFRPFYYAWIIIAWICVYKTLLKLHTLLKGTVAHQYKIGQQYQEEKLNRKEEKRRGRTTLSPNYCFFKTGSNTSKSEPSLLSHAI